MRTLISTPWPENAGSAIVYIVKAEDPDSGLYWDGSSWAAETSLSAEWDSVLYQYYWPADDSVSLPDSPFRWMLSSVSGDKMAAGIYQFTALDCGSALGTYGVAKESTLQQSFKQQLISMYNLPWSDIQDWIYIDPIAGDDSGTGDYDSPFQTLSGARNSSRLTLVDQAYNGVRGNIIFLRGGSHYLSETFDFRSGGSWECQPVAIIGIANGPLYMHSCDIILEAGCNDANAAGDANHKAVLAFGRGGHMRGVRFTINDPSYISGFNFVAHMDRNSSIENCSFYNVYHLTNPVYAAWMFGESSYFVNNTIYGPSRAIACDEGVIIENNRHVYMEISGGLQSAAPLCATYWIDMGATFDGPLVARNNSFSSRYLLSSLPIPLTAFYFTASTENIFGSVQLVDTTYPPDNSNFVYFVQDPTHDWEPEHLQVYYLSMTSSAITSSDVLSALSAYEATGVASKSDLATIGVDPSAISASVLLSLSAYGTSGVAEQATLLTISITGSSSAQIVDAITGHGNIYWTKIVGIPLEEFSIIVKKDPA